MFGKEDPQPSMARMSWDKQITGAVKLKAKTGPSFLFYTLTPALYGVNCLFLLCHNVLPHHGPEPGVKDCGLKSLSQEASFIL